jgi:hypothetical protein
VLKTKRHNEAIFEWINLQKSIFIFRNCIGQAFAQNEEKVLIARLINRYDNL